MPDREKVIEHLYDCLAASRPENMWVFVRKTIVGDALALLKEQEAVKPIYNGEKYGDHLPHCGNCEKVLPDNAVYGKVNFCHYCGKAVK